MNTATSAGAPRLERLSAMDVGNLRIEDRGMPMHVAALALLDGAGLLDPAGGLRLDEVRRHVEQRTCLAPRLRQVLSSPRRGRPFWTDDATFDITRHVRTRRVPQPGDETSLLSLCCQLNEPPLDRSRPLWEMWLLTGLQDGRVGLLIRLHHVVADGIAALALLAPMFDLAPDAKDAAPGTPDSPGTPAPPQPVAAPRHSYRLAARLVTGVRQLATVARQGRAPAVSWNRPVGSRRRLMVLRADLAATKAVAHRHGGKVNDVVLAAVAGGARRLLESRGELSTDLVLNVSVAASVRGAEEVGGNRVGVRVVPVPVGEPDAVTRLDRIVAVTAAQRARPPYQPGGRLLQRWMVRVMFHQRLVNLLLSNVPGPPVPLYFFGARVQELFQVGVVQGNLALGVGVLSYAGQLNVDIVSDADVVPDADIFTAGVSEALDHLGATGLSPSRRTASR